MAHIHRNAILPFSVEQMYVLVNDVASYPQYLDGCSNTIIHEESDTHMLATLALAKKGIKLEFTTRNILDAPKSITLQLDDGPFDQFEGRWFFQHLADDACKVLLDLQFSLSSKISSVAANKLLDSIGNNMVDAMVKRAKHVYG